MAEQLTKICQYWKDDETGVVTCKTYLYPDGNFAGEEVVEEGNESTDAKASLSELPKGRLPDEFPGLKVLDEAGIHTYNQLAKYKDLTKIAGIGKATAEKIADAVANLESE